MFGNFYTCSQDQKIGKPNDLSLGSRKSGPKLSTVTYNYKNIIGKLSISTINISNKSWLLRFINHDYLDLYHEGLIVHQHVVINPVIVIQMYTDITFHMDEI